VTRRLTGIAKWLRLAVKGVKGAASPLPLRFVLHMLVTMRHEKLTVLGGRTIVNANYPPLESRAYEMASRALARISRDERPLMSVCIATTARCPFDCFYCSARTYRTGDELTTRELLDLVGQVQDMDAFAIEFSGGEPMLRDDLPDAVASADDRSVKSLYTSGLHFPKGASALRAAGLDYVVVSLDTFDEDAYNRRRGHPNAFRIAIDAIEAAVAEGFYTGVGMMPDETMLDAGRLDAFVAEAGRLGVHEVRVLAPRPCVALGRERTRTFTRAQTDRIFAFQKRINRRADLPTVLSLDQLEYPEAQGCYGGSIYIFVTADGEVTPCEFHPVSFGSIREQPLREIHARMREHIPHPVEHCPLGRTYAQIADVPDADLPIRDDARIDAIYRELNPAAQPTPTFWRKLGLKP